MSKHDSLPTTNNLNLNISFHKPDSILHPLPSHELVGSGITLELVAERCNIEDVVTIRKEYRYMYNYNRFFQETQNIQLLLTEHWFDKNDYYL